MQCSAVQCSAFQYSVVQCSAVQCSALQCSAVQCSAVQCSAGVVQCDSDKDHSVTLSLHHFNTLSQQAKTPLIHTVIIDPKYAYKKNISVVKSQQNRDELLQAPPSRSDIQLSSNIFVGPSNTLQRF